jgi:hypothetical protein
MQDTSNRMYCFVYSLATRIITLGTICHGPILGRVPRNRIPTMRSRMRSQHG